MIQQRLIGSLTFILALLFPILGIALYLIPELKDATMEAFSGELIDQFIVIYGFIVDGLLGLVAGVLLYKGIKAGYLLGILIWGGAIIPHLYEMYKVFIGVEAFQEGSFDIYTILINIIVISIDIFIVRTLYKELRINTNDRIDNSNLVSN